MQLFYDSDVYVNKKVSIFNDIRNLNPHAEIALWQSG